MIYLSYFFDSSWDHSIVTQKTAKSFKLDIMNQMIRDLNRHALENRVPSLKDKLFRCLAWLLVVATLAGSGTLIYFVFSKWQPNALEDLKCREGGGSNSTLTSYQCSALDYAPSIVVRIGHSSSEVQYGCHIITFQ